jgi:hypothetical protein
LFRDYRAAVGINPGEFEAEGHRSPVASGAGKRAPQSLKNTSAEEADCHH